LSQNKAISVRGNRRSFRTVFNQRKGFAVFETAIYSASVVDVNTDFSFCDSQEIFEFSSLNKLPKTDHQLSIQLQYSESLNPAMNI
jgi:hypothetical protein